MVKKQTGYNLQDVTRPADNGLARFDMQVCGLGIMKLCGYAAGVLRHSRRQKLHIQFGGSIHHLNRGVKIIRERDEIVTTRTLAETIDDSRPERFFRRLLCEEDGGIIDAGITQGHCGGQVRFTLRPIILCKPP